MYQSKEYFPLPVKSRSINPKTYKIGNSCVPKPSFGCTIKAATAIVMIIGITANLVPRPINTSIEQINSAKTTSKKEVTAPIPKGSPKVISSLPKNVKSFGNPWVSVKAEIPTLKISKPKSTWERFKFVEYVFFIVLILTER